MIRSRLAHLKGLIYAIATLLLAVSVLELGLRVHSATCELPDKAFEQSLIAPSWTTHHRLRPIPAAAQTPATAPRAAFTVNSLGIRGPEPLVPKPPELLRVVYLGDEFVLEPDVADNQTMCARLAGMLQQQLGIPVEVINAGVPEFSPMLSYLQLRHHMLALQPDLILINVDPSDAADTLHYRRHTLIDSVQGPLACPHPDLLSPQKPNTARRVCDELRLVRWVSDQVGDWMSSGEQSAAPVLSIPVEEHPMAPEELDQMLAPLAYALRLVRGSSARLVVTLTPAGDNQGWVELSNAIERRLTESRFQVFVPQQLRNPERFVPGSGAGTEQLEPSTDYPRQLLQFFNENPGILAATSPVGPARLRRLDQPQ